jgi:hypothetical protein
MIHTNAKDCYIDFKESEHGVWYMPYARCNIEGKDRNFLMIVRHVFTDLDVSESDYEMYENHWLEREERRDAAELEGRSRYDVK